MRIVTDLDGVLRELNQYIVETFGVPYPDNWNWKYEGKNIFDFVRSNPEILFYSPKTKYFDLIMNYFKPEIVEIWTCQPESWRPLTKAWCDKNIGIGKYIAHYLTTEQKYDKLMSEKDTYLIEDSPNFSDYSKIVLIDMPYNQKVKSDIRITSIEQLKIILEKLK